MYTGVNVAVLNFTLKEKVDTGRVSTRWVATRIFLFWTSEVVTRFYCDTCCWRLTWHLFRYVWILPYCMGPIVISSYFWLWSKVEHCVGEFGQRFLINRFFVNLLFFTKLPIKHIVQFCCSALSSFTLES